MDISSHDGPVVPCLGLGMSHSGTSGADHARADLVVRPITGARELDAVHALTYEAFRENGYCEANPRRRLIHYPALDRNPRTTVVVAVLAGEIVGTLSWTHDGPAGLHIDRDFAAEAAGLRREGRTLSAGWRLATRPRCRFESRVVTALIQAMVDRVVLDGIGICAFIFNPRHEYCYQRVLGMRTVARRENTEGLIHAPGVLMRVNREQIPERWLHGVQLRGAA